MQGEGWAGWRTGQMPGGSETEREPSPSGEGTVLPLGLGERGLGLPEMAGTQRGFGNVLGAPSSLLSPAQT